MGRYERQIVNAFDETGDWAAMRAPASGGATDRSLPDILVAHSVTIDGLGRTMVTLADGYAIELKTTKDSTVYVDEEEGEELIDFADRFGVAPAIAAKFKRGGGKRTKFWIAPITAVRRTDSGTYAVDKRDIERRATVYVLPATESKPAEVQLMNHG